MKPTAIARFRQKLASGEPLYGLRITAEAAAITDIAVAMGLDWILLDADQLGSRCVAEHVRATRRSNTVVFIRQPAGSRASPNRMMSLGADGLLTIAEGDDEVDSIALGLGDREFGAVRPLIAILLQANSDDRLLNELLHSADIDMVFLERHAALDAERRLNLIRTAGKHAGILLEGEFDSVQERERGFQVLSLGTDTGILFEELQRAQAVAKGSAEETARYAPLPEHR